MGLLSLIFKKVFSGGRASVKPATLQRIQGDWKNIDIQLQGKTPSQLKQALITADKTLDNALRDLVAGEKMGERLKNAKDLYDYPVYDKIWKAHKMRNSLVHEAGFEPPYHVLISAVEDLRTGLKKIGVNV